MRGKIAKAIRIKALNEIQRHHKKVYNAYRKIGGTVVCVGPRALYLMMKNAYKEGKLKI